MKTIKKSVSVILSLLMIFAACSLFAFAKDNTVVWDDETYTIGTALNEGKNTFSSLGSYAFEFTAEKEGMYSALFSIKEKGDEYGYSYGIAEYAADGIIKDSKDYYGSEEYETMCLFEKGEKAYFLISTEGEIENYSLDIEYIGKVTDFNLCSEYVQGNINADVYEADNGFECELDIPVSYKTDTGKEFTSSYISFPVDFNKLESKRYTLSVNSINCEKEISFEVFFASDLIKNIVPAQGFVEPKIHLDDEGDIEWVETDENSFKVEYVLANGETVSNNSESYEFTLTLDDGRTVVLYSDVVKGEDGKYYFVVGDFNGLKIKVSQATVADDENNDKPEEKPEKHNGTIKFIYNMFKKIYKYMKFAIKKLISFLPKK